ncbi:MAG: prolyl aminopeptidase [Legionellales bacterium]|nr:prolyl aminopeptidase [Legionellales bacterium]
MQFPPIEPYQSGYLSVDSQHTLYYEQCGNPRGIPVLFVHGGPGSGCTTAHRRLFHPNHYRIILVDQRGCGRSQPHTSLIENTTDHLVNDFERLRDHLKIEKWLLLGGSWGSTLSLIYSIRHPNAVLGLILRGIFLARPDEITWLTQAGAHHMAPEAWATFIAHLTHSEQTAILSSYYHRLTHKNPIVQQQAAKHFVNWEHAISTLTPKPRTPDTDQDLALARIEAHYLHHSCFIKHTPILDHIKALQHLPIDIIQGRYDLVCPPRSAFELFKALPQSTLTLTHAGHAFDETETQQALIQATEDFRQRDLTLSGYDK